MLRVSKRATPQVLGFGLTRQAALSRAHVEAAQGVAGITAAQSAAAASRRAHVA